MGLRNPTYQTVMEYQKFETWRNTNQIPTEVKTIVDAVLEKCGFEIAFGETEEESNESVISLINRGGYTYGYGKGFKMSYCTSSMLDGPGVDPKYIIDFIKGIGFTIENSYGDNGMDSATNWHDTYWTYEFLYKPSIIYTEYLD